MNCSTILWVSVSQGQLLGNMSLTEVCGSLTKTVKPSLIWAPLSDGSRPWGEGGWSSRPWYKGLGRGLEKKILAHLASVCSRNEGGCPLPSGSATASMKWTALLRTFTWSQRCQNPNNSTCAMRILPRVPLEFSNELQDWAASLKRSNLG